jgi:hypothetical protein
MVVQIEENIFLSRVKNVFSPGNKINGHEDTSDTLSLKKLVSLETFTVDFQ